MLKHILQRFLSLTLVVITVIMLLPAVSIPTWAATPGDLTGLSNSDIGASYTATDSGSNASWSASGNTITGKVISASGTCGDTAYETTLTLTNNKSTAATLSFDYAIAQNSGTIQVAGAPVTGNGSYSGKLAAGDSITVYLKSGSTSADTSISITNLALISDASATTTFLPGENGSYTVDGVEITAETSKTQSSTVAYTLAATPASGYQFFGWYSVTGIKYLSSDATATLNFDSNQTIKPVFIDASLAIFETGGARFYDLNEANTYAVANGQDKIALISDGTLPSGSYTISSGITLLIPFDASYTCYTTEPEVVYAAHVSPTAYKILTMASGASITVENGGTISVSSKLCAYGQNAASWNGTPTGPHGRIDMRQGSSITLKSGAKLCVYGYIAGDGSVLAQSGSTVYECFQIRCWRGGTATCGSAANALAGKLNSVFEDNRIFPMNQYYIQNIEVPLTLESGASEIVWTGANVSSRAYSASATFIGTGGLFVSTSGSITKRYDGESDRLIFDVNGDAKVSSFTLKVATITLNTANFVMPITNNFTININSGKTLVSQDIALLPGTELGIDKGAEVEIDSNCKVYVYDKQEWDNYAYAGGQLNPVGYSTVNGTKMIRNATNLDDAKMDINGTFTVNGAFYTTASGANIISSGETGAVVFSNGAGTESYTYQATQSGSTMTKVDIPITSAKLHNGPNRAEAEPEYTATAGAGAGTTYNYCTTCDIWRTGNHYTVNFYIGGELAHTEHITSGNSATYTVLNLDTCDYSNHSYDAETGVLTINNLTNSETDVYLTLKEIISVTVTWDDLSYTYTYGTWQPESHTYDDDTLKWNGATEAQGNPRVTITNQSQNVDLEAKLAYANTNASFSGSFSAVGGTALANGNTVSLPTPTDSQLESGGNTYVVEFALTGTLDRGAAAGTATVGTITVTISKPTP